MCSSDLVDGLFALIFPSAALSIVTFFVSRGRFPLRVLCSVLLAAIVCMGSFFIKSLSSVGVIRKRARVKSILLMSGICIVACVSFDSAVNACTAKEEAVQEWKLQRSIMERYCIDNPDNLYIHDTTLIGVADPFTVYSDGKPTNCLFFGGIRYNSPVYYQQLAINGLKALHANQFFDEGIYFMTLYPVDEFLPYSLPFVNLIIDEYGATGYELVDVLEEDIMVYRFVR